MGLDTTQPSSYSVWPLGQVQTGPKGLSRQRYPHLLHSHGFVTGIQEHVLRGFGSLRPSCTKDSGVILTFRLLMAVVQHDIGSMVNAGGQVLHNALAKLVHPEDDISNVGDTVDIILKYINAEGMEELCI